MAAVLKGVEMHTHELLYGKYSVVYQHKFRGNHNEHLQESDPQPPTSLQLGPIPQQVHKIDPRMRAFESNCIHDLFLLALDCI